MPIRVKAAAPRLTVLVLLLVTVLLAACSQPAELSVPVDRTNGESVIRGWFDAWERSDWRGQLSLMERGRQQPLRIPASSLRIVEIRRTDALSMEVAAYDVVFDVQVTNTTPELISGRHSWHFELGFQPRTKTWLIGGWTGLAYVARELSRITTRLIDA